MVVFRADRAWLSRVSALGALAGLLLACGENARSSQLDHAHVGDAGEHVPYHGADELDAGDGAMRDADAGSDVAVDAGGQPCFGCLIEGLCTADGVERPGDPCHVCDLSRSDHAWSIREGVRCGEGRECYEPGQCDAQGACIQRPEASGASCAANEACARSTCDGHGACLRHVFAENTPCGDRFDCHALGACDASGACQPGALLEPGAECTDHGQCVAGQQGLACACVPGYSVQGRTCADVDECAAGSSSCDAAPSACVNDSGKYHCACPPDFTGNGLGKLGCQCARADYSPACKPWTDVAVSSDHSCAISAGALYCWGVNDHGQLGLGDTDTRFVAARVGSEADWQTVSVGRGYSCAIRSGSLYCWGANKLGAFGSDAPVQSAKPVRIGDASDWSAISVGSLDYPFSCGLRAAGHLYCWGVFADGTSLHPTLLSSTGFDRVRVSANGHACALRQGELYCWGAGVRGTDAQGQSVQCDVPTRVGTFSDYSALDVAYGHSAAIRGGHVQVWGQDFGVAPLVLDDFSDFTQVALRESALCAVRSGGQAYCWQGGAAGTLNTALASTRANETELGSGFTTLRASPDLACGLRDGGLVCSGQLARTGFSLLPERLPESDFKVVAAGGDQTCALRGRGELYCWGNVTLAGQTRSPWLRARVGDADDWLSIAVGAHHVCGIRPPGNLYCWGNNAYHQLGIGGAIMQAQPVRVGKASDWTHVSAGEAQTCAVRGQDGALYCWGGVNRVDVPALVLDTGVSDVSVGAQAICAVQQGVGLCWGFGPLGSDGANAPSPRPIASDAELVRVFVSNAHACATDAAGSLWCWGSNRFGQLGDGLNDDSAQPVPVAGGAFRVVSPGATHTCGVTEEGALACWGDNAAGQRGDMSSLPALAPRTLEGYGYEQISSGANHTCALRAGVVSCWGSNQYGQLGSDRGFVVRELASGNDFF